MKNYKRIIAICLVFSLAFSLAFSSLESGTFAFATDGDTAVTSANDAYQTVSKTENISGITWTDWDGTSSSTLPDYDSTIVSSSMNLKMTKDIELTASLYIKAGVTVNLDLNGYTLSFSDSLTSLSTDSDGSIIVVEGTLNIYDSESGVSSYTYDDKDTVDTDDDGIYYFTGGAITGGSTSSTTNNVHVGAITGGGGIFLRETGTVVQYGGTIIGNSTVGSNSQGGGVYISSGATYTMYGGAISYNSSSTNGGGVYALGNFVLDGGSVSHNSTANYGGGLYVVGDCEIKSGDISYNSSSMGAGGVSVVGNLTMTGGTITGNTANGSGGGVLLGSNGVLNMSGGSITNNTAVASGGGVTMTQATCSLIMSGDAVISGNEAKYYGAGVYFNKGTLDVSEDISISGNYTTSTKTNNNVYIVSGNTITVSAALTGLKTVVGVTYADGTGIIAGSAATDSGTYLQIVSDIDTYYRETASDGTVSLISVKNIDGTNQTVTYSPSGIEISDSLGFFDADDIASGDTTYVVTPIDGEGSYNSENNTLSVSSCGTFLVTVSVDNSKDTTVPPKTGTAILTVEPLTISVYSVKAVSKGVEADNLKVELDREDYEIFIDYDDNGVFDSGEEVTEHVDLDFGSSYGLIKNEEYYEDSTLVSDGTQTFDITIHGLTLSGVDSGNYVLASTEDLTSTVTINTAIPAIAWPQATDIVYGQDQEDSILSGGKVFAVVDGVYTEITSYGEFTWVGSAENEIAGSYSHRVKFVINETALATAFPNENFTALISALASTTHYVSYDVQAAAVSFVVNDNSNYIQANGVTNTSGLVSFTATSEIGKTLDASEFGVIYYYTGVYDAETIDTSVKDSEYYYGTEFYLNANGVYNYHHSGSADSIAKQIGMIQIYETSTSEIVAKTVSFEYADGSTATTSIKGSVGDVHALPTLTTLDENGNAKYVGWKLYGTDTVYDFGARYSQTANDVTFVAVEAVYGYTLSGTVSGTDLDGTSGALSGVSVFLMQGADLIDSAVTDASGEYSFVVASGRYTVVAMRDLGSFSNTESIYVNVDDTSTSVSVGEIALPSISQNITLNVDSGFSGITAEGLYNLIDKSEENTIHVNVDQVLLYGTAYNAILSQAAQDGYTTDNVKLFYDINATEQEGTSSTYALGDIVSLDSFDNGLTFYIPLAGIYQNKDTYWVYKYTADGVVTLSSDTTQDEYFEILDDKTTLAIHTTTPTVYALGFYNNPTTQTGGTISDKETYSEDAIDITKYVETILGDDYAKYASSGYTISVAGDTGEGVFDSATNTLTVSKVGDFVISVTIPASANDGERELVVSSSLTVDPAEVTVYGIVANSRSFVYGNYYTSINTAYGNIDGVLNGDTLTLDLSGAIGTIIDAEQDYYDDNDSSYYQIEISGVKLSGADAGNYTIASVTNSNVYIDSLATYYSWPTATDIYYTQTLADSTLFGGKVVAGGNTIDGEFVWDTDSLALTSQSAGTYTATVYFDVADSAEGSYKYIEDTTHEVEYTIHATSVSFAVSLAGEDNTITYTGNDLTSSISVTATDKFEETVDSSQYNITYTKLDLETLLSSAVTEIVDTGVYLVNAEFTTSNYHHAGTSESTGKQIGSFIVVDNENNYSGYTGFTVEFYIDDVIDESLTISNADYQDIHITPYIYESDGETVSTDYIGWEKADGTYYAFGARLPHNVPDDITLYAVPAEQAYSISGTIIGTELGASTNSDTVGLSNIAVALMQGSDIVATGWTDASGDYIFSGISDGRYTLVVTRDELVYNIVSRFIEVDGENLPDVDFELSDLIQNTSLNVASGVGSITVKGVNSLIGEDEENYINIYITAPNIDGEDEAEYEALAEYAQTEYGLTTENLKIFYNINLEQWDEHGSFEALTYLGDNTYLEFYIPLAGAYQGKDNYVVYRYHDNGDGTYSIDVLTEEENDDGEYISVVGDTVYMKVCKFSLYGIAFYDNEVVSSSSGGSSISLSFDVNFDLDGGSMATSIASQKGSATITLPGDAEKSGYEFVAWVEDSTGDTYLAGESYTMKSKDVYFTAIWQAVESGDVATLYSVSYDMVGGIGTYIETAYYSAGDVVTVAGDGFAKDGYTLAGLSSSANGVTYQVGDTFALSENVVLSAVWTQDSSSALSAGIPSYIWWIIIILIIAFFFFIIWKRRKKDEEEEEENTTAIDAK